jgi:circadian clock protein KaiC
MPSVERARTGIPGLDDILGGGLPRNRLYLVQGDPGVGKTTLGLQFLREGVANGETCMYVTLSETVEEIEGVAASHGWSLDGIRVHEHSAGEQLEAHHTIFYASEVDLTETMGKLLTAVDEVRPTRIVFDSLSELRLLAGDVLRYRREILALKQHFAGGKCTVMLLDDRTSDAGDRQLQSLCHGVLLLEQDAPSYGADHRRLRVTKMRGLQFRSGFHDFAVRTGGLDVYPRLIAAEHRSELPTEIVSSGIEELDRLLGGGLDRGASTVLLGPSGSGKSTVATQFAVAAAGRGQSTAMYCFDESPAMLFARSKGLGIDLQKHVESGLITVQPIDPSELMAGEFVHLVREAVENTGVQMVVIDSLTGYLNAMPEERSLMLVLHELLTYLGQKGVTSFLIMTQHGMVGTNMSTTVDISYLADTVLLFRFFEHAGEVRQALSVFKRRGGAHERSIREMSLGAPKGIILGQPLRQFRGVLTGVPLYDMSREENA